MKTLWLTGIILLRRKVVFWLSLVALVMVWLMNDEAASLTVKFVFTALLLGILPLLAGLVARSITRHD